jgi:hypothetical protein
VTWIAVGNAVTSRKLGQLGISGEQTLVGEWSDEAGKTMMAVVNPMMNPALRKREQLSKGTPAVDRQLRLVQMRFGNGGGIRAPFVRRGRSLCNSFSRAKSDDNLVGNTNPMFARSQKMCDVTTTASAAKPVGRRQSRETIISVPPMLYRSAEAGVMSKKARSSLKPSLKSRGNKSASTSPGLRAPPRLNPLLTQGRLKGTMTASALAAFAVHRQSLQPSGPCILPETTSDYVNPMHSRLALRRGSDNPLLTASVVPPSGVSSVAGLTKANGVYVSRLASRRLKSRDRS